MGKKPYNGSKIGVLIKAVMSIIVVICILPCSALIALAAQHNDLFSVSFPTDNDGWVCGRWGSVLHTRDGGKTWEEQDSGTDYTISDIYFTDHMNGWAVGDGGTIIHTNDGGKSWVKQESPVLVWLMGVQFVTPKKGFIVAEGTTILATENGGENWEVRFKDQDFILKRVSFCDEQNGWAAGEYGFIYHTSDGGKTWEHQAGKFELSDETMSIVAGDLLYDVIAVDPQTAWVVGIEGYVSMTQDGGETWTQVLSSDIPKKHLFTIYANKNEGVSIGGNALVLQSTDCGKGFQKAKVEPAVSYSWFYRIRPRGNAGLVAVGGNGLIYLGDRKGSMWNRAIY